MPLTRRPALAALLAFALAAPLAASPAARAAPGAGADDPAGVEAAVDALTKAMLAGDRPALEALALDALSYGHSSGLVQDKAAFIATLTDGKSSFPRIALSNRSAAVTGEDAVVRHTFDGEVVADGKAAPVHIGVLQVWHRDGGRWRLLARQAFKL